MKPTSHQHSHHSIFTSLNASVILFWLQSISTGDHVNLISLWLHYYCSEPHRNRSFVRKWIWRTREKQNEERNDWTCVEKCNRPRCLQLYLFEQFFVIMLFAGEAHDGSQWNFLMIKKNIMMQFRIMVECGCDRCFCRSISPKPTRE